MSKEQPANTGQQSFFYRLLMGPGRGFRICRHILLILGLAAVSFNQTYMGFFEYKELVGNNLYLCAFLILLSYMFEGYFNMYILIPRYLFKGKYITYLILFLLLLFLLVILHYTLEYAVFRIYNIEPGIYSYYKSYGSPFLLEFAASYFVDSIAVLGAGLIVVLKHWLINDRRKSQLEKVHMQAEVEKQKEQINPEFLLAILHKIGDVTIENQQKASDMLMELSELLRYQLYDSNREKVLLNAEISFITNYLRIEKLYYEKMDFKINTTGEVHRILIPPFLFIPLVQYATKNLQKKGDYFFMNVCFQSTADFISFSCNCSNAELLALKDLDKIKLRLESLYNDRYLLETRYNQTKELPALYLQLNV